MRQSKVRRKRAALLLAILTPLLTTIVGIASIAGAELDSATGQPNLVAAIVNNDLVSMTDPTLATSGLAGRELVGELVTSQDSGFQWEITDAATAQAGLESGEYSAVVTIPDNFTAAYVSSTTSTPEQAVLSVETNGSQSYIAALLARSLAANLQSGVSSVFTQGFVDTLLVSITGIGDGLGEVASGANALQQGLGEMASLSGQLPGLTSDLAQGSRMVTNGVFLLGDALWSVGAYTDKTITDTGTLASEITTLKNYVEANVSAGPTKTAIVNQLTALQTNADSLVLQAVETSLAVDAGAAAADVIGAGSEVLTDGSQLLSDGMPLFSTGLTAAQQGAGLLASGLNVASEALPKYSADQAAQLAKVISQPVETELTSVPPLPPVVAAVAAFTIPIALWFGALVLSFVYRPFEPRALRTRASTSRIVWGAVLPPVGLAAVQAALLILGAAAVSVSPVHHLGMLMLIVFSAVSFVLLHQGLAGLVGRSAWLISIALMGLQIVAAGVLVPTSFLPKWVSSLGEVLPLSQSIQASQVFLTGGTFSVGSGALFWLVLTAVLGICLLTVAVNRGRRLSLTQPALP